MLAPGTARPRPRRRPQSSGGLRTARRGGGANNRRNAALAAQPWQSPAVAALVQRTTTNEGVAPMLVEGPRGTSLRAVGCATDHRVAGDALGRCVAERKRRASARGGPEVLLPPPRAAAAASHRNGALPRVAEFEDALPDLSLGRPTPLRKKRHDDYVFGAVYEHVDAFGRPKLINSTAMTPERQYLEDGRNRSDVSRLLVAERGASRVVWAGIGRRVAGPRRPGDFFFRLGERR